MSDELEQEETSSFYSGRIIICRELISPYSNEPRYQLACVKDWSTIPNHTSEELEEVANGLNILEIIQNPNILNTPITDFQNLDNEQISNIKILNSNDINVLTNVNEKNIIDPSVPLEFKAIADTSYNDLKKVPSSILPLKDESFNISYATIILIPITLYKELFDEYDDLPNDDYLEYTQDDYMDQIVENTDADPDPVPDENETTVRYKMLNFYNNSETGEEYSLLVNIIEDLPRTLNDFKINDGDVVKLYEQNTAVFESEFEELNQRMEALTLTHRQYLETKESLQTSINEKQTLITLKEQEIEEFENSHKGLPEDVEDGEEYFDPEFLDEEERSEYNVLVYDLATLNEDKSSLEESLNANESNDKSTEIEEVTTQITKLENIQNANILNTIIPLKYLTEIDTALYKNTDELIPENYFVRVIDESEVEVVEKDFSDTETDNAPYYYIIGKIVQREINGTTQDCIDVVNLESYSSVKSFLNLKTYFNFNKVYLSSSEVKEYINSQRDPLSNNELSEINKNIIINDYIIPMEDTSELLVSDSLTIIPSLSILIVDDDYEPGEGGNNTEQPDDEDEFDEEEYKKYLRGGDIFIVNDVIFVIPNNSYVAKRIVFVNGFYYILLNSCYIYKLNTDFELVTTIDLTKISTDISKTDIFSVGNMLIIQSDKTYVTDLESVKNNYGIADTDVVIENRKINTKSIVKVSFKK